MGRRSRIGRGRGNVWSGHASWRTITGTGAARLAWICLVVRRVLRALQAGTAMWGERVGVMR
jgi:hypothetical protein